MRQLVFGIGDDVAFEIGDALLDFPFRDIDALANFDTPQLG